MSCRLEKYCSFINNQQKSNFLDILNFDWSIETNKNHPKKMKKLTFVCLLFLFSAFLAQMAPTNSLNSITQSLTGKDLRLSMAWSDSQTNNYGSGNIAEDIGFLYWVRTKII